MATFKLTITPGEGERGDACLIELLRVPEGQAMLKKALALMAQAHNGGSSATVESIKRIGGNLEISYELPISAL